MNTKNNLQSALKGAFENHQVPLNEAQWTRLEGALIKRKRKWIFPFVFSILTIGFFAGLILFNIINTNQINQVGNIESVNSNVTEIQSVSEKIQVNATEPHSDIKNNKTTANLYPFKNSKKRVQKYKTVNTNYTNEIIDDPLIAPFESTINISGTKELAIEETAKGEYNVEENSGKNETNELTEANKDSISIPVFNAQTIKEDLPIKVASKFSFSLAGGYSQMNVQVKSLENSQAMHKDSRQLFENANKNLRSEFFTFGFDWNAFPKRRIGFSTGLQYLRVASKVNINYKLTEVPFWNANHTRIDGYVTKDPNSAMELNANTTNYTTYLIIPLKVNYTIPINVKNDIMFSAGTNITTLAGAKGQNIDISNEPKVNSLQPSMFRKFNTGLAGGFQYSSKLNSKWWLGIDNTWQSNPMKYKIGDGNIKNKLQGYSVNLLLKYKI
jgi:hypothetical protein